MLIVIILLAVQINLFKYYARNADIYCKGIPHIRVEF